MFPLEQDKWEVRLTLPESGRKITSDVYAFWLEQVKLTLMSRIGQLGHPSVIPLC